MSGFSSFWSDNESTFDKGEKPFCLNSSRQEALDDTIIMYQETIQHLLDLLHMARLERDEAREHLQKSLARTQEFQELLNRVTSSNFSQAQSVVPYYTSGTYNSSNNSQCSSSVDCNNAYRTSSPASNNASVSDSTDFFMKQQHYVDSTGFVRLDTGFLSNNLTINNADFVIDELVKGKPLPEKGKLLQAVMDARLLIETLVDPVPVPKWRNPPPLPRFRIPPYSHIAVNSNLGSPSSSALNFAVDSEACLNSGICTMPMGMINARCIQ